MTEAPDYQETSPNHLINEAGHPFGENDLVRTKSQLSRLSNADRIEFRNQNASCIAQSDSRRILIVSGPGTGKSFLFFERVRFWLETHPESDVIVTTFVRKLAQDLEREIISTTNLSDEMKKRVTVTTLHRFARSIVEKNHGTAQWVYRPHIKMIGEEWKQVIWDDVLALLQSSESIPETWKLFEEQLHNDNFLTGGRWVLLRELYFNLCRYYNASGFADIILRARDALQENPKLLDSAYFILDEYQDFNAGEESLLLQMDSVGKGLLIAGDDDQVLYDCLKGSTAELIRRLYTSSEYANAMLPFCSRCSFHIASAATYFLEHQNDSTRIPKIFLPLQTETDDDKKVRIIGCAKPSSAIEYIKNFINENRVGIEERRHELKAFTSRDAFLLILSPSRDCRYLGSAKAALHSLVSQFRGTPEIYSEDYYRLIDYYLLAEFPGDNFRFRKVLHYSGLSARQIGPFLSTALSSDVPLIELEFSAVQTQFENACKIHAILDTTPDPALAVARLEPVFKVFDSAALVSQLAARPISRANRDELVQVSDDAAERFSELERSTSAVDLMTIIGSKGLSADHVIVLGFDNVNFGYITPNAFFVAITRARKSLHLITALQAGGASSPHAYADNLHPSSVECLIYKKTDHSENIIGSLQELYGYCKRRSGFSRR